MLVKKTITHRKGPSKEMGLDKIVRSRSGLAGIDRRDYGFDKNFCRHRGIEEPYWGPSEVWVRGCMFVCVTDHTA